MFRRQMAHAARAFVFPVACALLAAQISTAQTTASGTLTGSVTETSGGAVSGAKITATDQKTNVQQTALADAAGQFSFDGLAAGTYTVKAEFPGFGAAEKRDITSPGTLQLSLTPSASATTVDVNERIDPFEAVPSAPTNSVFGLDTPLPEIPRSIPVVPAEMMTRYDIQTVNDLVTASPGSFTGSYFGVPGALFIRGEAGDNFYRGFRRVENRGNYETPVADSVRHRAERQRRWSKQQKSVDRARAQSHLILRRSIGELAKLQKARFLCEQSQDHSKSAPGPAAASTGTPAGFDALMALADKQLAQRYRESGMSSFCNPAPTAPAADSSFCKTAPTATPTPKLVPRNAQCSLRFRSKTQAVLWKRCPAGPEQGCLTLFRGSKFER